MKYYTPELASELVDSYYLSSEGPRTLWDKLNKQDRLTVINKAESLIDSLPLLGRKKNPQQEGNFPRYKDNVEFDKPAVTILRGALFNEIQKLVEKENASEFAKYQAANIKEYKVEGASVTFHEPSTTKSQSFIYQDIKTDFLNDWLVY